MRPLLKTGTPKEIQTQSAYALLINAFGPYCAISEEPLYDVAYVWDKAANAEVPAHQPPSGNWRNLLLLSPATCEAWLRHHPHPSSELLLPDEDTTFGLEESPFVYALEPIDVIYTDDADRQLSESGTEELAIIEGTTAKAQATIETFSLNTEYFNPERKELLIPWDEHLSRQDAIIRSRTLAWLRAADAADQLEALPSDQRNALFRQLQISAAATGHWSVWATVLWSRLEDRDFVSSVLGSRASLLGLGPHNEFPGTASTWFTEPIILRFEVSSLDPKRRTLEFVPEAEEFSRELQALVAAQYVGATLGIQRAAGTPVNPAVQELVLSVRWPAASEEQEAALTNTVTAELRNLFGVKLRNLFIKSLGTEGRPKRKPGPQKKSHSSSRKRKK